MVTAHFFSPATFFPERVHDGRLTIEILQWESIRFTLDTTVTREEYAWEYFHLPFLSAGWSFPGRKVRKVSVQFHVEVPRLLPSARLYTVLCFLLYVDSHFQIFLVVADEVPPQPAVLAVGSDRYEWPQPVPEPLAQRRFCIFSMYHAYRKAWGTSCIRPLALLLFWISSSRHERHHKHHQIYQSCVFSVLRQLWILGRSLPKAVGSDLQNEGWHCIGSISRHLLCEKSAVWMALDVTVPGDDHSSVPVIGLNYVYIWWYHVFYAFW